MKELVVFNDPTFQVSTVMDEKNEPWFMVGDVCKCLGLGNVSRALDNLEERWKADITISNASYDPKVNGSKKRMKVLFVNEPGLYSLIFKSRKQEAINFRNWVCEEVLPSIRKNGEYNMTRSRLKPTYKELASSCFMKETNKESGLRTLQRVINMVNEALTGMKASECEEKYGISPRDYLLKYEPKKLEKYEYLQMIVKNELEEGKEILQIKSILKAMGYKL